MNSTLLWKCTNCPETRLESFHKDASRSSGLSYACKRCEGLRGKERVVRARRDHRARELVKTIKGRAKNRGVHFDLDAHILDIQDRIDEGVCELSGMPFVLQKGRSPYSPSIDRIIPELGYTYANIRVICVALNCAIGDWGLDVLRDIMAGVTLQRETMPGSCPRN
jgi:hypothetical protein